MEAQTIIFINPDKRKYPDMPKQCPFCHGKLMHTPPNEDWILLDSAMTVKGKECADCGTISHSCMNLPLSNRQKRKLVKHFMFITNTPFSEIKDYKEYLDKINSSEELAIFIVLKFRSAKSYVYETMVDLCQIDPYNHVMR